MSGETIPPIRRSSSDIPASALREMEAAYNELRRELSLLGIDAPAIDRISKSNRGHMLNACTESQRTGMSFGARHALATVPAFVACRACGATVDVPR